MSGRADWDVVGLGKGNGAVVSLELEPPFPCRDALSQEEVLTNLCRRAGGSVRWALVSRGAIFGGGWVDWLWRFAFVSD